jgi:hypothetical protein
MSYYHLLERSRGTDEEFLETVAKYLERRKNKGSWKGLATLYYARITVLGKKKFCDPDLKNLGGYGSVIIGNPVMDKRIDPKTGHLTFECLLKEDGTINGHEMEKFEKVVSSMRPLIPITIKYIEENAWPRKNVLQQTTIITE